MEAAILTGYNGRDVSLGAIPYIEVQWNRKWKEFGIWSAYLRAEDYRYVDTAQNTMKWVRLEGRPEVGIIQKVEFKQTLKGDFITLSGYFLHALLNRASSVLTYPITSRYSLLRYCARTCGAFSRVPDTVYANTFPEEAVKTGGGTAFYKVSYTTPSVIADADVSGKVVEPKTGVGDALNSILPQRLSFTADTQISSSGGYDEIGMTVKFKEGRDKTSLVFSEANKNVEEMQYAIDKSNSCAMIRTILKTEKDIDLHNYNWDEYYLASSAYTDADGHNIYVVHSDADVAWPTEQTPVRSIDGETQYEIKAANANKIITELRSKGNLEGLNHYIEQSVDMKVLQISGYQYLTDYDLGDQVTVSFPLNGFSDYSARILEVREVHKENKCDVELTIGKAYYRAHRF